MKKIKLHRSIFCAMEGIWYCLKEERNVKIHLLIASLVMLLAYVLQVHYLEALILLLAVALIVSLEIMNTAVERTVDLITDDYHPLAKIAKDVSAASVFFAALIAVIVGAVIFLKYIF